MELIIKVQIEDGKVVDTKVEEPKKDNNHGEPLSQYYAFFDEFSTKWTSIPSKNISFLRETERKANEILKERGHIYLNEVLDMLGIHRNSEGNTVGWVYNLRDLKRNNHISFGMYATPSYKNEYLERGSYITIEFNVDGDIRGQY